MSKKEDINKQEAEELKEETKEEIKEEIKEQPKEKTQEELLKEEIEKLKKDSAENKDRWMRSVAEFDNYKKRNAKIWSDAYAEGKTDVILKILPIGDNLDLALSMGLDQKTTEGLQMLKRKFDDVLKEMEIEEINPVGEKFDPNVAEAIMQAEKGEGEESDTVKQVFQKGYKLKDKIIRYAKCSIIK